ncbi:MAG: SpoIIE family protein phosphatase [Bacteroidetes bacterium]|nr:SpoIIE family protein phosphatase [Bacteroidota bacterium]
MIAALNILLLEDSEIDADILIMFLNRQKIKFVHTRVWTREQFIGALELSSYDIIIADHSLPQFTGMDAFRIMKSKEKTQGTPFILLTGTVPEHILIQYAKEGVDEYILKDNLLRLPSAIDHLITKKKIELLLKKLETAHREIQDSIACAKRIQNSILPDKELLKEIASESFILFKPKDKVSGDFYFFRKDESGSLITVADCTGHGVPGAMMSMVGIEKLNNLFRKIRNPSEILKKLNKSLRTALSAGDFESSEGMDIAVCQIENDSNTLKFSGANRPLWIIRKGQTEVEEIEGTKSAIGYNFANIENPEYECHEIKLNEGDTFYIFSDGFADQFGGEKNKKITTKKFKQQLLSIQDKTMLEQGNYLNDFLENWMGAEEQIDDILVIGIRKEKSLSV